MHCLADRLNLVLQQSCNSFKTRGTFFQLSVVYLHFSSVLPSELMEPIRSWKNEYLPQLLHDEHQTQKFLVLWNSLK